MNHRANIRPWACQYLKKYTKSCVITRMSNSILFQTMTISWQQRHWEDRELNRASSSLVELTKLSAVPSFIISITFPQTKKNYLCHLKTSGCVQVLTCSSLVWTDRPCSSRDILLDHPTALSDEHQSLVGEDWPHTHLLTQYMPYNWSTSRACCSAKMR